MKWLPAAVLFVIGFNMSLPDYKWATPIQLAHGVFIDNALLIAYLFAVATTGDLGRILRGRTALEFSGLVAALSALGIISAGVNGYALADIGEALRLSLFAAFVLVVCYWGSVRGETALLRAFLIGVTVGALINIFYSITEPEFILGILPALRSSNGAGGLIAISLCMSAWLMLLRKTRLDLIVSLTSGVVALVASAISFSKTSMLIAASGLIVWFFVLLYTMSARHLRMAGAVALIALSSLVVLVVRSENASRVVAAVGRAVYVKFGNIQLSDKYSVGARYMYFWAVGEIMAARPIAGASYTGFYDAVTQTETYRSGQMLDESADAAKSGIPNPHNSFLYYAAANGFPGLALSVVIYFFFLFILWRSLRPIGFSAGGMVLGFALAYFVYGMTLPTLYDTAVLYLPAAIALSILRRPRPSDDGIATEQLPVTG